MHMHDDQPEPNEPIGPTLQRFAELWMANQHMLGGFVRLQVRDHHLAEDIVQEVARDATANFHEYDPSRPFGAWLTGIARMRMAEHFRKHGRKPLTFSSDLIDKVEQSYVKMQPEIDDRLALLEKCLLGLGDRHRRLIQMRYEHFLSSEEIAAKVGAKVGSVNVTIHRIRIALAQCVQDKLERQR